MSNDVEAPAAQAADTVARVGVWHNKVRSSFVQSTVPMRPESSGSYGAQQRTAQRRTAQLGCWITTGGFRGANERVFGRSWKWKIVKAFRRPRTALCCQSTELAITTTTTTTTTTTARRPALHCGRTRRPREYRPISFRGSSFSHSYSRMYVSETLSLTPSCTKLFALPVSASREFSLKHFYVTLPFSFIVSVKKIQNGYLLTVFFFFFQFDNQLSVHRF